MHRIKIVKIYNTENYDYENSEILRAVADGIDWHEVDEKKFQEITKLVSFANRNRYDLKADYNLELIEEIAPSSVEDHLQKAKELLLAHEEKYRKIKEKEEKTRIAKEEKRKATELERKRKQLERLQKELENDSGN